MCEEGGKENRVTVGKETGEDSHEDKRKRRKVEGMMRGDDQRGRKKKVMIGNVMSRRKGEKSERRDGGLEEES